MEKERNQNPNIIDYLDYKAYLKDKFFYLSSVNKKKSIRWFAKKAGINSPQLISMVINGKRKLSKEMASSISYAIELTDDEEEYLLLLIDLQDSRIGDHREEILQRIRSQFHGGLFQNLNRDDLEYLAKWYYPVVRESIGLPQENKIGDYLGLTYDEVKEAYDFLLKIGLAKKVGNKIEKGDQSVWFKDGISPLALMKYHFEMISRSLDELKVKKEEQHFETLTVSIPKKNIPDLKKKIHRFMCEIDTWLEETTAQDQIIQLNVNFTSWLQDKK
ncbi:TIGR02147 family protein [Bacteriovoracaceae bacterium]|nr:TIGR02147 family protein [Bacteriovoracaceae bacterium]